MSEPMRDDDTVKEIADLIGQLESGEDQISYLMDLENCSSDSQLEELFEEVEARVLNPEGNLPYDADRPPGTSGSWGEA
jgi:hypothetical protein